MNRRKAWISGITVAVAIVAAACGGGSGGNNNSSNQTGTLTVWLMNGTAPASVIDGVNADFKGKYPNVTVNVEIQQWGDVGTKLDTAFSLTTPPTAMHLGNTLLPKYPTPSALLHI